MFSNFPGQFVPLRLEKGVFFTKCGDQEKEVEDVIYIVTDGLLHP